MHPHWTTTARPNLKPAARAGLAATPLAHPALVTRDVFLGFEDPDLSSLIESGQKWGPNCADDVPVRGTRACPFWFDWEQKGSKTQGKPSKMTLDMVLSAG